MTKIFDSLKKNWQFLVIIFLIYLLLKGRITPLSSPTYYQKSAPSYLDNTAVSQMESSAILPAAGGNLNTSEVKERLVIKNTWLSLLVKNVRQVNKLIIKEAENLGGYLVDSQITSPEGIDSGTVTIRVPTKKLNEALNFIKNQSIRVVSENLEGHDVTDEYIDIKARLETLNKTKEKFEEILNKAEKIPEILEVQRELINLQSQIDSLKGQEQYLEKNAQNAKITVYLASDELALPYTPVKPWRPEVIFKQAVRSLVSTLRQGGTAIIWFSVYSVIWLPLLLAFFFFRKKLKKLNC